MGEGEQLHAQRRRRFWAILGWLALLGAVAGFLSGFWAGFTDARGGEITGQMQAAAAAGILLLAAAAAYGSWKFFVSVDEVEVADNLWGSLIGFYAYALLFPTWWALWKISLVDAPDHWFIYGVAMLTAMAAYGFRKWQSR
jgi:hypothetical protein